MEGLRQTINALFPSSPGGQEQSWLSAPVGGTEGKGGHVRFGEFVGIAE